MTLFLSKIMIGHNKGGKMSVVWAFMLLIGATGFNLQAINVLTWNL